MSTKPDIEANVNLAVLLSKIVHDAQDEHGLRTRHDIGLVLLAALIAEGGEIAAVPEDRQGLMLMAEPGRYLVFPIPAEEETTT